MIKKIRKMQVFRHIIQVILFFLLPDLYTLAFSEFKKIYAMIIDGNFHFIQAVPSLMEFITVIVLTILLGRFFCGWICAFGTYNDWIHLLAKNVFRINFKVNEKVDSVLKYVKYVILIMLLIVVCTMGSNIFNNTSPWDAFAQITDLSYVLSNLTIGFILLILITIGSFFVERFFCRYLCPLGAVFTIFSKISIFKIKKPKDKCGKCRICTNNCSMGLPIYKVNNVRGGECINCLKCVDVCPRKNAQANVLGENVNLALASSVAIAAFTGIYSLNNYAGAIVTENGLASTTSVVSSTTTASNNNSNQNVANSSSSSTKGDSTSNAQVNTNKESVSESKKSGAGSNITSNVNNSTNNSTTSSNSTKTSTDSSTNQQQKYKDGAYTGTGTGFRGGTTEISVTVKGDKITNIETLSTQDTPRYYDYSKDTMFSEIISAQSTSVDTVSGATYSSRGIIEAVENALSKA